MTKVMMVGSAEESGGGVTAALKLIKKMPIWKKYSIYWLGTQLQRNAAWKLWYAIRATIVAPFIMWRYDIVHFHSVPGTGLIIQLPQLLIAKLYRKKVIVEIHVGNQLNNHTNDKFFKWWLQKADRILLLAYKWEKLFKSKYADINTPTDVLYNACESISGVSRNEKIKLILFAGFMNDNKAPHLLLKAWKMIKDKYPDWHVTLMGDGDVERFKKMAIDLDLGDSVDFPGYVVGEQRENIMRTASIFCMCSYEEGFPMVVLESWTRNVAVVTTPVGGLPDVIVDGNNCLVFPFGDSEKLSECLEKLIGDEYLRWLIGSNGCTLATKLFSLETISEAIDMIYQKVQKP